MWSTVLLSCLLATAFGDQIEEELKERSTRIVNGNEASTGAYPYQVSFQVEYLGHWYHICGGTIVTRNKIVTAAHCAVAYPQFPWRVELGTVVINDVTNPNRQAIDVASYEIHEGYTPLDNLPNDIAILTLASKARITRFVQPALLPSNRDQFVDQPCVITGFGYVNATSGASPVLRETTTRAMSNDACNAHYRAVAEDRAYVLDGQICVLDLNRPVGHRPGACYGDSGGPAMCGRHFKFFAGIASWLVSCDGEHPVTYTRVSYYLDWIRARLHDKQ
ncbi:fibrinolytic enzyme, isozyme C-like [Physella acuta]|uniref:fibrinolytic enzyme, isozyme C-like n=1 Tax=Physella acuta TaxID=109671 RepID=UPI0027DC99F5|nr:fibrinolytic enzyme, isozyme C-like [Physella acuta]